MTKVRVIKAYYDLKLKEQLAVGDVRDMTEARAEELSGKNNAMGMPLVEIVETPTAEPVTKKSRKKAENE